MSRAIEKDGVLNKPIANATLDEMYFILHLFPYGIRLPSGNGTEGDGKDEHEI
jgi:hypothetical protein